MTYLSVAQGITLVQQYVCVSMHRKHIAKCIFCDPCLLLLTCAALPSFYVIFSAAPTSQSGPPAARLNELTSQWQLLVAVSGYSSDVLPLVCFENRFVRWQHIAPYKVVLSNHTEVYLLRNWTEQNFFIRATLWSIFGLGFLLTCYFYKAFTPEVIIFPSL